MTLMTKTKFVAGLLSSFGAAKCPLQSDTNIVYSLADGVGDASRVWIQDLLWWWKSADSSIKYQGLTSSDIQQCSLADYTNLRIFLSPGGNTYDQLSSLGTTGRNHILSYIQRQSPSAFVGFCAGGYLAASGYYWETMHEDRSYFQKFGTAPPLGAFPYEVEGSIVDIADDQFGDLEPPGVKYRLVNVSNGHKMLYYGGSTFGWNQVTDMSADPDVNVLSYYSDFYGYLSYNLPAVWSYKNLLLTSVHPEADNCTKYDCPVAGTIPTENILQNRAWLVSHINTVAGTNFVVPSVKVQPSFDITPPHSNYPEMSCYQGGTPRYPPILFCDDFDTALGVVPSGMWNWERGQTEYSAPRPWNITHTSKYGVPADGNGYALAMNQGQASEKWASISTFPVSTPYGSKLIYQWCGTFSRGGLFTVQYTTNAGVSWTNLNVPQVRSSWSEVQLSLPTASSLQVRFNCGGSSICHLDSVFITAPTTAELAV